MAFTRGWFKGGKKEITIVKRLSDELHASGIYRIIGPTGFYYGSATTFYKRWNEHKRRLNNGTHHSIRLQRAWNKHGSGVFTFEIVQNTTKEELETIEQHWLDNLHKYIPVENIYNVSPSSRANRGYKFTAEQLKRHGDVRRGKKLSDAHKKKISKSLLGNKRSLGLTYSDGARDNTALGHSGGKSYTIISPNGDIFEKVVNIRSFCRDHNLQDTHMGQVLRGIVKQHKGYTGFINAKGNDHV